MVKIAFSRLAFVFRYCGDLEFSLAPTPYHKVCLVGTGTGTVVPSLAISVKHAQGVQCHLSMLRNSNSLLKESYCISLLELQFIFGEN